MPATVSPFRSYRFAITHLLMLAAWLVPAPIHAEVDQASGLIIDEGWESIRDTCGNCHSLRLVTSQRADRRTWLETIRWMQENQNLQQFDINTENSILDYLSKNYPPIEHQRRMPLSPQYLPEVP